MKKRAMLATAMGAVVAIGLAGCGGGTTTGGGSSGSGAAPAANAAIGKIFNPSDKKGGTLKFANSGDWDSIDPGDTYYGYSWDFIRLYTKALVTFKNGPAKESLEIAGDLAEGPGVASDDNKTWTYKLKPNQKYEDGTVITSKDVKYAVLRSYDKEIFPNGPEYFKALLNFPEGYQGAYKSKDVDPTSAIETPDDNTVVFHLKAPLGDFDQFAQLPQTAPVPAAKDTGAAYKDHVISSGPYMFEKVEVGKGFSLVRNPNWDPATDPNRKALPDRIEVSTGVASEDIDNRLISGDLHVDVVGTGVGPATLGRVVGDPTLKARTDNPSIARLWYTSVNPQVAPLDNIDCRIAVQYATDKVAYQTAVGGELSGGDVATTVIPPLVPGYEKFDLYPAGADNRGDVAKAKEHLAKCGKPDGFATNVAYRAERPKEKAVAEALQQSLARVGIQVNAKPLAQKDYFSGTAGRPPYARQEGLGLVVNGWQTDWNDPFAFLSQITDSRVIKETGGSSNISVRIPEVDQMLDQMVASPDEAQREKLATDIDKRIMQEAVILPGTYAKALVVRGKGLTNVYINEQYGMYDYTALGLE
ncbi:ABC transporter substrate-binding protein [Pseudonocardia sp. TRM90224]|uniref:ABC transporter substrate-binding protein n=1 Tax=Pseudonocardia sp. TRM90224 TaxID=2812678 RepID=UPI001E3C652D|nr:ABC transporter substrate-binding protein [Pseudonocardia sp. TRM90224]